MRYEVTIYLDEEIHTAIDIIKKFDIKAINITHKVTEVPVLNALYGLREAFPDLDIVMHLSMRYLLGSNDAQTENNLSEYIHEAQKMGIERFLVVSGYGNKTYDSLKTIDFLSNKFPELILDCAYNPYLGNVQDEQTRVAEKLKYKQVKGVYLQVGTDIRKTLIAKDYLRSVKSDVEIFGSILVPTPELLKRFRYHPLPDVVLDDTYLQDLVHAWTVTRDLLLIYKDAKIMPFVENIPFSYEGINDLKNIVGKLQEI